MTNVIGATKRMSTPVIHKKPPCALETRIGSWDSAGELEVGLGATYLLHCIQHLLSHLKTFFLVCLVPFGSCPRLTLSLCSNSILEFSCRYCTCYVPSWIHTELYELVTVLTTVCLLGHCWTPCWRSCRIAHSGSWTLFLIADSRDAVNLTAYLELDFYLGLWLLTMNFISLVSPTYVKPWTAQFQALQRF